MNYEQKYREALERARTSLSYPDYPGFMRVDVIFPELKKKESEDERIRKEIIDFLGLPHPQFVGKRDHEKWIAWLEEQGEKKSTDNYKPKFNAGDWITDGHLTCKVLSAAGKSYELHLYNDDYCHFETDVKSVDKHYRLWTISDAKDGDVLACPSNLGDRLVVFIFKQLVNHMSEIDCHCCIDANGIFDPCLNDCCYVGDVDCADYIPATKPERNLLFQAMKEAGYEWDNEKKELKKIEPKKLDVWNAEDEQNLNVVLSFIPDECLRRWLKDKLCYDTLDADKVIEWLTANVRLYASLNFLYESDCPTGDVEVESLIKSFKKDFGL